MNNTFKAFLFLILFIFLVIGITTKVAAQSKGGIKPLGNIPTRSSCDCAVFKGFKQTSNKNGELTIKSGLAILYADAIVFEIGSKSITLVQMKPDIYIDTDKNELWLARVDNEGDIIFQSKKTIYYYSPKGLIK